jgi:hypothetical protein
MVMGSPHTHDGDAGRWTKAGDIFRPPYAAPWFTVRTYRGQAAPSSSGHTISPHAGRRPLCVSAPIFLWLTTKGHVKLLHCCCTPTIQLGCAIAFAYTAWWLVDPSSPGVATPAGCMHMPPTVCPLLEPTDRHAGQTHRHEALLYSLISMLAS